MIFSPQSDLSSFRDYYQNSTERDNIRLDKEGSLALGIYNFKMSKVFHRLQWKVQRNQTFMLRLAFQKMAETKTKSNIIVLRNLKLKRLIQRFRRNNSYNNDKRQTLHMWLSSIASIRDFQLQLRKMETQLKSLFIKKNASLRWLGFNTLLTITQQSRQKLPKYKETYIRRLRKALFSIVFRNRIQMKIKSDFEILKNTDALRQEKSSITFFKQRKDKKVHQYKEDSKIRELEQSEIIFNWIAKKIQVNQNFFLLKLRQSSQKVIYKKKPSLKDSPQIMTNVVKHMIYLTHQVTTKIKDQQQYSRETIRDLKLRGVLMKIGQKQRQLKTSCLFDWRREIKYHNGEIEKQIAKLQQIKRYYIQEV